jgi:hypothetical protein
VRTLFRGASPHMSQTMPISAAPMLARPSEVETRTMHAGASRAPKRGADSASDPPVAPVTGTAGPTMDVRAGRGVARVVGLAVVVGALGAAFLVRQRGSSPVAAAPPAVTAPVAPPPAPVAPPPAPVVPPAPVAIPSPTPVSAAPSPPPVAEPPASPPPPAPSVPASARHAAHAKGTHARKAVPASDVGGRVVQAPVVAPRPAPAPPAPAGAGAPILE